MFLLSSSKLEMNLVVWLKVPMGQGKPLYGKVTLLISTKILQAWNPSFLEYY